MTIINGIEMDDGVDEPNDHDCKWDDESPLGPEGCIFPRECCMPGPHYESECHTPQMLLDLEAEMTKQPNNESSQAAGRKESNE